MAGSPGRAVAEGADDLFDRYLLPKVALSVILVASLVGTAVTTALSGRASVGLVLATWSYLVALGVLGGGLLWKHGFVRPADVGSDTGVYCERMYARFDRIAGGALVVLLVAGPVVLLEYDRALGDGTVPVVLAALLGGLLVATGVSVLRERTVEDAFRSIPGLAALGLTAGVVVVTASLEVQLRGGGPAAVLVRSTHLLAFTVWLGGAVWNIFVAVPTGKQHRTVSVVAAAGQQLERFRWAVRFVIPLVILTGVYQAVDAIGVDVGAYSGSFVGLAVLGKLGFVAVLVVIFKLCPMWRACSPVEGICDLEELDLDSESETGESTDD